MLSNLVYANCGQLYRSRCSTRSWKFPARSFLSSPCSGKTGNLVAEWHLQLLSIVASVGMLHSCQRWTRRAGLWADRWEREKRAWHVL